MKRWTPEEMTEQHEKKHTEYLSGEDLIQHVEQLHYGIPGWPGEWMVSRVSQEKAAHITHEQDHENSEGIRFNHTHKDDQ